MVPRFLNSKLTPLSEKDLRLLRELIDGPATS